MANIYNGKWSDSLFDDQSNIIQKTQQFKLKSLQTTANQSILPEFEIIKNKKNFTVAVRIKPQLISDNQTCISISVQKNSLKSEQLKLSFDNKKYDSYGQNNEKKYIFDKIFETNSQNKLIFKELIEKKLDLLRKGVNLSLMAYGATNSGKTYTIFGKKAEEDKQKEQKDHKAYGISYLTFAKIFQQFHDDYQINFSFVQIYNQNVFDLLNPEGINSSLNVMQDSQGNTNVIGLRKIEIFSLQYLQDLINQGNNARISSSNIHNIYSSRSHAFMELELKNKITRQKTKMVIVDLAGSQKYVYNSSILSNLLKQGSNINKSLLSLGNCIKSLYENQQHIPYRDSKLTRLLKQNLSGFAHNIMIACINQKASNFDQNLNSLNYALKAMKIQKQIVRKVQSQELSEYQCSSCQQKLSYALIKQINKHQEHKKRVKTRQSQSLSVSPISTKNKEQFCFKSKSLSATKLLNEQKINHIIEESFFDLSQTIQRVNFLDINLLRNVLSQQKMKLKQNIKERIFETVIKNNSKQKLDHSIVISQFENSEKPLQTLNRNVSQQIYQKPPQRKLKVISLSKPKKKGQQRTASTNHNSNATSKNNSMVLTQQKQKNQIKHNSSKDLIKIQDQSLESSQEISSFRSNLTVQILDDKQKVLNQRRQILEQTSYNQRKNSSSYQQNNLLKFKSTQNSFKNKNIENFITRGFQQALNKIKFKSTQPLIKIQENDEKIVQPFQPYIINNRLLDSTAVAPRMKKDEDQLGAWRNIFIKSVQSPMNFSPHHKPDFEESFVQYKIGALDQKQSITKMFRY